MTTQGIPTSVMSYYEALFRSDLVAVAFIDPALCYVRVNQAWGEMDGAEPAAHAGRPMGEVISSLTEEVEQLLRQVLDERVSVRRIVAAETSVAPGRPRRFLLHYEPALDESGAVVGLVAMAVEVTDEATPTTFLQRASQLALAVELVEMGTWEWDAAGGTVNWSPQLERIYGLDPGSFRGTFEAYLELVHPDDRAQVLRRIEENQAGSGAAYRVEHRVVLADGRVRWIEGRGSRVLDERGRNVGLTGIAIDVTDRKLAEERLIQENEVVEALYEMSCELGGERRVEALLDKVTQAATRLTGAAFGAFFYAKAGPDGRTFWLYTLAGAPRSAFEAFPMPSKTAVFAPTFDGTGVVRFDDVTTEPEFGHNPPYYGMPAGHLPVRSYLAVPVAGSGGEVLGGLFFGHAEPARFTETHERVAVGIAAQAAIALENARLHDAAQQEIAARQAAFEERDRVARLLQRSLLPPHLPEVPGVELAARFVPLTEGVGGDFYDVFQLQGKGWAVAMGDVCGKGPEAAAVTALTRYTLRAAAMTEGHPTRVLDLLNQVLLNDAGNGGDIRFCTVAFARFVAMAGGVRLQAALGGHPPLLVLRAGGALEHHGVHGTILGAFPNVHLREFRVDLGPGDLCLFYTDGATDVRSRGRTFGEDRLADVVRRCAGCSAEELVAAVEAEVLAFQEGHVHDDLALLAIGAKQPER